MERLRRGDKPINEQDSISMAHDIRYALKPQDQKEADQKMLSALKTKSSFLNPNTAIAYTGIAVKDKLLGNIKVDDKLTDQDRLLAQDKLKELES